MREEGDAQQNAGLLLEECKDPLEERKHVRMQSQASAVFKSPSKSSTNTPSPTRKGAPKDRLSIGHKQCALTMFVLDMMRSSEDSCSITMLQLIDRLLSFNMREMVRLLVTNFQRVAKSSFVSLELTEA